MSGGAANPPLAGLRVLDLSTVLAGPNCARYLADFGADVIKVERPDGGDSLRNMAWRDPRDGGGLWWKLVNRNKRTVALDLKSDADREVLLRLVAEADVLVENFRPGTLERLGLGPDVLLARRPSLVVTRVTGFGQDGPYSHRPGFASIAESMSGLAALSGEPDGQPLLPAIALTDEVTGLVGGVRHDGGAALGRRPGGRRQPAGEPVPADGPVDLALRADRRAAAAPRVGAAVLGAPRHLPLRRRQVGGHLDLRRQRRPSGGRAARRR